jgi:hypothetical protein
MSVGGRTAQEGLELDFELEALFKGHTWRSGMTSTVLEIDWRQLLF